jgi:flagellar hook assembly protein FlgD
MRYKNAEVGADRQPKEFRLYQNFPNPFRDTTTIRFAVPKTSLVRLTLFDRHHQLVEVLLDGQRPAGYYTIIWEGTAADGHHLADGFYTYRLEANGFVASRKLEIRSGKK